MSYKEQVVGAGILEYFPCWIGILSYKMEGIGEGMFEVDFYAGSVTIFTAFRS